MAKVYAPPQDMPPPEPDFKSYDFDKEQRREEAWMRKLAERLRAANDGELVGEVIMTPRGDGHAQYMISSHKPFSIVHLPLGDCWRADHIWERGLRLSDARAMVKRKKLKTPFANIP
jgi:hypothetical protein